MNRQDDYETGPQPATDGDPAEKPMGDPAGAAGSAGPVKRGLAIGSVAFLTVYAITYQLTSAMVAVGYVEGADPSRWILAGLAMLGSHGARLEAGGEPLRAEWLFGFLAPVLAIVPVVVLTAAGFVLVRQVATDDRRVTVRRTGITGAGVALTYVTLAALLARVSRWTRGGDGGGAPGAGVGADGPATVVAPIDSSFVTTVGATAVVFLGLGAVVALLVTTAGPGAGPATARRSGDVGVTEGTAANEGIGSDDDSARAGAHAERVPQADRVPHGGDERESGYERGSGAGRGPDEKRESREENGSGGSDTDPTSRYGTQNRAEE